MAVYPNQRVTRSEKENESFYKATYDYLINKAIMLNPKQDLTAWLEAANGIISNASIKYLVTPLTDPKDNKAIGELPGQIRDTDLVNMVRERNIGEYIGLPYKFTVTVDNADAILKRDAAVAEEVNKLMEQSLINMLNEYYTNQDPNAQGTGVQSKEVPDIEKFAKEFIENWVDDRAIDGFHILKLINTANDFDSKRLQCFFYWWACEEFYTYREVINNEVYTSVISPLEGFPIYNDEQFVEDYTGFVIKRKITLSKVKQLYWDKLSKAEQDYVTSLTTNATGNYVASGQMLMSRYMGSEITNDFRANQTKEFDITDNTESFEEYITIWRTEVPIKIRSFVDSLGIEQEEVVPIEYVQTEIDTNVREEWIEEVYIGRRFGNETTGVYLKPEPCDVQRYDNHTMQPKLPVGGKKGILRNILQNPISKRLIPYVIIDRMILLMQERTIAKYQGYIQIVPQSLLNDDLAGTKNQKLFFMKADNMLVYDDTSVDFNTVAQGFRVVGMPEVANYLMTLITLRDKYKAEGLEIANMNSNRLGDVMASTGKGVMQESIYRAALGNVLAITMFNAALERDHNADLDFSKIAYQDEIRGSYFDKESGKGIYVNINLATHKETMYGVHVENSKIDQDKIDMFKQLGFNASQNGDIEAAVDAIALDSIPELRKALKAIAEANRKLQQATEENNSATQKYVADAQTARQDSINEVAKYVSDNAKETAITVAEMKIEADIPTGDDYKFDETDNTDKTALQREQLDFKKNDANAKNQLKDRQMRSTERINNEKLKLAKSKPTSSTSSKK
jgi:hypothetical protein